MNKQKLFVPMDYLVIIYCALNILYISLGIVRHGLESARLHNPLKHLVIFLLIIVLIFVLKHLKLRYNNKFLQLISEWYVMPLFLYFFEATSAFNRVLFPDFVDPFFQKIDFAIFGYQPAVMWQKMADHWLISEVLYGAYFSYYLIGFFYLAVYLQDRVRFRMYAFILTFVFFLCYLTYNILPVVGGRYFPGMMELAETPQYGIFSRIMAFIYASSPHKGGAFPSSHVAVAVVVLMSAFDYKRLWGYILFLPVLLLAIATVYCHYHYFIDTVFGLLYALVFYFTGKYIFQKFDSGALNV